MRVGEERGKGERQTPGPTSQAEATRRSTHEAPVPLPRAALGSPCSHKQSTKNRMSQLTWLEKGGAN